MKTKIKNILVTGGAGYIGSHIVEQLVKTKAKVFIIDNLSTGYKKLVNKRAFFIKGDIADISKTKKIIKDKNIYSIIHLAALLNVREAEKLKKKYYNNNVLGTLNLIKACKNSNVRNIIFSSSCSIYGNVNGSVNEIKKPNPHGYYAYTKYKCEQIIKKYSKEYKYKYAILRYFNVAGASNSNKIGEIQKSHGHLIKNLAIQALKKKPKVFIYGKNYHTKDGTCIRDYIHVADLSDIHLKSLHFIDKNSKSLILNCGYGKGYSVLDVINVFKKVKKNVLTIYSNRRSGDVAEVFADVKKMKKILKWKPKYNNMSKIIKSAIKWERQSV